MNDEHEDDELDGEEFEIYEVDDSTRLLIETACNCIVALSEAQLLEESKQGLLAVADALANRFGIEALEVEEEIHSTDEGEEIIYKPKGGIFQDKDEGEAPTSP